MSAHDRYLAGYSSTPVRCICVDCGQEWDGTLVSEYGQDWLEPRDDCLTCGSTDIDTEELDELDIQERKLEARGIDF